MKHSLILFILFFVAGQSSAQLDSSSISISAPWVKGDAWNLKVTKIKQRWTNGELNKNDSTSYIGKLEVIDTSSYDFTFTWSVVNNLSRDYHIPPELLDRFSKYQLTRVIYKANTVGEFAGIENWEEISEMMIGLFTDISEMLADENPEDKKMIEQIFEPFKSVYGSKEGIEQLVFPELQFIHFPYGISFPTRDTLHYEEQIPNTLGGKPIRGDALIFVDSIDVHNAYFKLHREMKLNPDDTRVFLSLLFKQMKQNKKEIRRALKTAIYNIEDEGNYGYFYTLGIPATIENSRVFTIKMDEVESRSLDKTMIERMK